VHLTLSGVRRRHPDEFGAPLDRCFPLASRQPGQLERIAGVRHEDRPTPNRRRRPERESGILLENPPLEIPKLRARVGPDLLDQQRAQRLEGPQRLPLTPGSVEGEHVIRSKPLLVWVLDHQRLDLTDEIGIAAGGQIGVEPCGLRGDP
jgi:hypothetical protein